MQVVSQVIGGAVLLQLKILPASLSFVLACKVLRIMLNVLHGAMPLSKPMVQLRSLMLLL